MDKQLKDKAINLQGKQYVQVVDRIQYFNEIFENGSIRTRLLSDPANIHYVVEAKVVPDTKNMDRYFSGLSQAKLGTQGANRDAALENAETSAIGRALGMMGIGVIDSVASVDEMNKANVGSPSATTAPKPATDGPMEGNTVPCKQCGGPTNYREGVSKASGKPYKGYFCATNREHAPFFV
jgi:hypothetical protein